MSFNPLFCKNNNSYKEKSLKTIRNYLPEQFLLENAESFSDKDLILLTHKINCLKKRRI